MYSSGSNIFAACAGSRLVIAIGLEVVLRAGKWGRWGNMEEGLDEWLNRVLGGVDCMFGALIYV